MRSSALDGLRLAGGTSLALQIGHRRSVDLDLFGTLNTDEFGLRKALSAHGDIITLKNSDNIHIYVISGIKVDIVNYPYPWIEDEVKDGIFRLAGKKDIAAMKLSAITGRGSKKDFIDIWFLLKQFSLKLMMEWYKEKYKDGSEFLVLKSLTYFDDAELEEMPVMLIPVNWTDVKDFIIRKIQEYLESQ